MSFMVSPCFSVRYSRLRGMIACYNNIKWNSTSKMRHPKLWFDYRSRRLRHHGTNQSGPETVPDDRGMRPRLRTMPEILHGGDFQMPRLLRPRFPEQTPVV